MEYTQFRLLFLYCVQAYTASKSKLISVLENRCNFDTGMGTMCFDRKMLRGGYLSNLISAVIILSALFPIISYAKDITPDWHSNDIAPSQITSSIPDGIYRIESAIDSSLVLSTGETINVDGNNPNGYKAPNACVRTLDETDTGQLWDVTGNDDGTYTFESVGAKGYSINYDVYNACSGDSDFVASSLLGTKGERNVMVFGNNGTAAQRWSLRQYADTNWFAIQNPNGMVLDVKDGKKISGQNVCGFKLNNSWAQKWHLVPAGDYGDNVTFSIPTRVPCLVRADGTAIAPTSEAWQICNLGTEPITLTGVSLGDTSGEARIEATATGLDIDDGGLGGNGAGGETGSWKIDIDTASGKAAVEKDNGRETEPHSKLAVIRSGERIGFDWAIDLADGTKHAVSDFPTAIADISFTFDRVCDAKADERNGTAFAVYSDTDNSLNYYKRDAIPEIGDWFCGKKVSTVYTGFENAEYSCSDPVHFDSNDTDGWMYQSSTAPWYAVRDRVNLIKAVDRGIAPRSLAFWFYRYSDADYIDLSNFDLSGTTSLGRAFLLCREVHAIKLPPITSACRTMPDAFACCFELKTLIFPSDSDFSGVTGERAFRHCFYQSAKLQYDASQWNVTANADHYEFNAQAGGVSLPIPWQMTAFAIYSDSDNSLDFYKRENWQIPSKNDVFYGKSVTEIYTGFESEKYIKSAGTNHMILDAECTTPWFVRRSSIKTAKVIDTGISPKYLNWWFCRFDSLESVDLSKLDGTNVTELYAFCTVLPKITSIKLPASMPSVATLCDAFYYLPALENLDLSCIDSTTPKNFYAAFGMCKKLKNLTLKKQIVHWDMSWCFQSCDSLIYDCSDWDVSSANTDIAGLDGTFPPNVTRPAAWQG